jgi:hypothetical protein
MVNLGQKGHAMRAFFIIKKTENLLEKVKNRLFYFSKMHFIEFLCYSTIFFDN